GRCLQPCALSQRIPCTSVVSLPTAKEALPWPRRPSRARPTRRRTYSASSAGPVPMTTRGCKAASSPASTASSSTSPPHCHHLAPSSTWAVALGGCCAPRQPVGPWPQLLGVDPAVVKVAVARRQSPLATFQVGLAEALPLPDASVDPA